MRLDEAMKAAAADLSNLPDGDGWRDARVLLSHLLGDREALFREPERQLTASEEIQFFEWVARRKSREPVSHIIGLREFYGRDFVVSSKVLDPRPDSETLIETVLARLDDDLSGPKILDLGVGSGCLLLTLLSEVPGSTGMGADLSEDALQVAKQNADALGLKDRVQFVQSNWLENVSGQYHVVISNPPYIETDDISTLEPEVRDFEPHLALDGGVTGLDCYKAILSKITPFLYPLGLMVFEIGQGQEDDLKELMVDAGFEDIQYHKDLASTVRCVSGRLKK
ncbi:peptide chain release factor N(5)-glutamine methyltransferase [Sneathiella limimaris]|uniref:peptide chain release factor N(5)-glutamine methyltransferase n=1 Tax=Sneathiella limimaris TaxID=1964213 RepID=UPI00146E7605|nr:peptide chain release factor N(5)-glutamine methyltransferase [Sneathiella limimaris]